MGAEIINTHGTTCDNEAYTYQSDIAYNRIALPLTSESTFITLVVSRRFVKRATASIMSRAKKVSRDR